MAPSYFNLKTFTKFHQEPIKYNGLRQRAINGT